MCIKSLVNERRKERGTQKNEPINGCKLHNGILNIHENTNMTNEYLSHTMELKTYKILEMSRCPVVPCPRRRIADAMPLTQANWLNFRYYVPVVPSILSDKQCASSLYSLQFIPFSVCFAFDADLERKKANSFVKTFCSAHKLIILKAFNGQKYCNKKKRQIKWCLAFSIHFFTCDFPVYGLYSVNILVCTII